jgi:DNA-directed RNA polymerase subunit RPC12/RpoP
MKQKISGTYFCMSCKKMFTANRIGDFQAVVKCPKCHLPNSVVKHSHPFVKMIEKGINTNDLQ